MTGYRRFASVRQMSVGLLAFAAVLVVLDSGGIYSWASRLELGPKRTFALPVAGVLHRGLARLGLEQEREDALVGLARVHWSDDPARMAQAAELAEAERTPIGPPPMPAPPEMSLGSDAAHAAVRVKQQELIRVMEGAPPLVSKLPEIEGVGAGKMRSVALAGDSMMAVGLSPAMLRAAPKYGDLEMLKLFKSGTGLARPEVFDWQQEYPAMLAQARPEFVIVAMGANDAQGFVENGVVYPFGSAGWQAIYQRRVQAYLEMLEADGATVVWLGLPPMRSEEYDAHVALINRIDATVVNASPHAIWFSTAGVVGDQAGKFRDFGEVAGRTARLRQGDGIHLSDDGATLVADKLLPWLAAQALPAGAVPKQ